MKTSAVRSCVLGIILSLGVPSADAQTTPEPLPLEPPAVEMEVEAETASVVRIGADYTVRAGETVREVVLIAGSAIIEGDVEGDVVVVLGVATLASAARVGGDFVVVGGSATVAPGAVVTRDVVVVGGELDAPPGFAPGGEQVTVAPFGVLDGVVAVVPWLNQGLLWGRPIVPSLPWVWVIVGVLFVVYLVVNVVFERPVRACTQVLAERPLTTGLAGLLVLLLIGPVFFVLVVSVLGAALVPFLLCALLIAGVLGRVGVARWMGTQVWSEDAPPSRLQATRSLVIGLALICLAYVVPVLGLVTWTMLGVFGLGAAATTFITGLRQEHPAPPLPPVSSSPPVSPTPETPTDASADEIAGSTGAIAPSAAPAGASDLSVFPRATFLSRLTAFVLDMILVMLTVLLFGVDGGVFFLLLLAYHVVFWGWKGTTVGGIICQLRVVRTDGTPLRVTEALVRALSSIFSIAVLGLGYFWILGDAERQAWHDKIAGTYVVKVPRNWPLP